MGGQDKSYGSYAEASDFFYQVLFVATAMSIVTGPIAERMKLIPFFSKSKTLKPVIASVIDIFTFSLK